MESVGKNNINIIYLSILYSVMNRLIKFGLYVTYMLG